jgi:sortase A
MRNRHAEGRPRSLRWLERLFLIAGAGALIWFAVIVSDGVLAQRHAQRALEIALAVDELTQPRGMEQPVPPSRPPALDVGAAMAALSIPRVQLSAVVLHGSDAQTLQRGPGHLEHTAVPGVMGNIVIAGHRDSFFRPLRHIRLADDIFLETRDGHFHYRVTSLRVVGPREVGVTAPTSEETLTLITCYPFWVLGPAPDRFIVRAVRVAEHVQAPLEARSRSPLDWSHVPTLAPVSLSKPISAPVSMATDDESRVRQTVRRYLRAQGVQRVECEVSVSEDRATADCGSVAHESPDEQPGRTFLLERSNNAWAIKSIELR